MGWSTSTLKNTLLFMDALGSNLIGVKETQDEQSYEDNSIANIIKHMEPIRNIYSYMRDNQLSELESYCYPAANTVTGEVFHQLTIQFTMLQNLNKYTAPVCNPLKFFMLQTLPYHISNRRAHLMVNFDSVRMHRILASIEEVDCLIMENGHAEMYRHKAIVPSNRVMNQRDNMWTKVTPIYDKDMVNIGQGFPDTLPAKVLLDAMKNLLDDSSFEVHQYTRGFGHPRLTNILAKLYSRLFNIIIDPMNEVTITLGGHNALFCSFLAYLNPGDEAIIIEPYFYCYAMQIELAGAKPVFVPLQLRRNTLKEGLSSNDFTLDMNELEASISPKTKLIVLNNPNNPSGKVFTNRELTGIASLVKKYNLIVVSDEVYEWIVYPGAEMIRFASLPGMWERTLTIGSAGKAFGATGWRTGWVIGPKSLMDHVRVVQQNCTYRCPTIFQEAFAIAYEKEYELLFTAQSYFRQLCNQLILKRDKMKQFLSSIRINPVVPEGGYFMLADFSKMNFPFDGFIDGNGSKDYAVTEWIGKEKKLACIPLSTFYSADHQFMGEKMVRFCFFKSDSTLEAADKIIKTWKLQIN